MATRIAPFAALVLGVAALLACPWDGRERGRQFPTLAASTSGPSSSERGIPCPIEDQ